MKVSLARWAVLAAFALAACSGGDGPTSPQMPPDPDPTTPTDVTLEEALGELSLVNAYAVAGLGPLGVGPFEAGVPMPAEVACPYNASSKYFICADETVEGLTLSHRYQIISTSGAPMSLFDPMAVGGIRSVVDVNGTMDLSGGSGDPYSLTIDAHNDHVLSGLQGTTRTVNGSGTANLSLSASGQTFNITTSHTITNLVLPPEMGPGAYPSSGSITTTASAPQVNFSATMTFNGTSTVTIVATMNGQSQSCTYNLATPETPAVCQP